MTNEEYQKDRVTALKLTQGKIREMYFKNVEALEKHLTTEQKETLKSLKVVAENPSYAIVAKGLSLLEPAFRAINQSSQVVECKRLIKYLGGWIRESI